MCGGGQTCSGDWDLPCWWLLPPPEVRLCLPYSGSVHQGPSGLTLPRQWVTGPMPGSPWKAAPAVPRPAVPRPADGARSQASAHAVRTKVRGASGCADCLTAVSSRGLFQGQGPGRNPWELGSELCQLSPGPAWGPKAAHVHWVLPRRQLPQVRGPHPQSPGHPAHKSLNALQSGDFPRRPGLALRAWAPHTHPWASEGPHSSLLLV